MKRMPVIAKIKQAMGDNQSIVLPDPFGINRAELDGDASLRNCIYVFHPSSTELPFIAILIHITQVGVL